MQRTKLLTAGLSLALLVLIVACQDVADVGGPAVTDSTVVQPAMQPDQDIMTLDEWFARTADAVPGFAGAYFDEEGKVNIRLVDVTRRAEAEAFLAPHLSRQLDASDELGVGQAPGVRPDVIQIVESEYNFRDLYDWKLLARRDILTLDGVRSLGISEEDNRLDIGIDDLSLSGMVEGELERLGIPLTAVRIRRAARFEFLTGSNPSVMESAPQSHQYLDQEVRPIVGGVQIQRSGSTCTLGFNVMYDGMKMFATNSHCSTHMFHDPDGDGTSWGQPNWTSSIGQEYKDPYGFRPCPDDHYCRYSDFTLGDYTSSMESNAVVGRIARPINDDGSLQIDPTIPYFTITDSSMSAPTNSMKGTTLHKVGRTTGWSSGKVKETCTDYEKDGYYTFCLTWVDARNGGGDSGSPVFRRYGTGSDVILHGILMARKLEWWWPWEWSWWFGYSPLSQIYKDFGAFDQLTYDDGSPPPDPDPLTVEISGPFEVRPGEWCTWQAFAEGGETPYDYDWSGKLSGSNSWIEGQLYSSGQLRVDVDSDDGQSAFDTIWITVSSSADPCWEDGDAVANR